MKVWSSAYTQVKCLTKQTVNKTSGITTAAVVAATATSNKKRNENKKIEMKPKNTGLYWLNAMIVCHLTKFAFVDARNGTAPNDSLYRITLEAIWSIHNASIHVQFDSTLPSNRNRSALWQCWLRHGGNDSTTQNSQQNTLHCLFVQNDVISLFIKPFSMALNWIPRFTI